MLELLIMGFVGKYYYELAQDHYKHRWGYAFLGVGLYYGSNVLYWILVPFIVVPLFGTGVITGSMAIIVPILFSLLMCLLVYVQLGRVWRKKEEPFVDEIDEIGNSQ